MDILIQLVKLAGSGAYLGHFPVFPGEGNRNVSIAGHRNGISNGKITDHAPFYYIDTLAEGDYLYLIDSTNIYRYLWESCTIVEADDWSPIYTTGKSCLTITSCHPIGVSDHRIVVRAALDKIFPYDKNFDFLETKEAAAS
ncbi:MAG TPA: class E sortase [Armatimonadota bacterium]|nr:class E sortase [Armatimonadota bacterium]